MISLVSFLVLGGMVFVEQDIPGLVADFGGSIESLPAQFRQVDIDQDGKLDIVLFRRVIFQRNGGFNVESSMPIPGIEKQPLCDTWGHALYLRTKGRLRILEWKEGAWQTSLDQSFEWPDVDIQDGSPNRTPGLKFDRFLHDINGDGVPEIVVAGKTGLQIYQRDGDLYTQVVCLDVFPPLAVSRMSAQPIWPQTERRITLPSRAMSCRYTVDGPHLTVIVREDMPSHQVRFRATQYTMDVSAGFAIDTTSTRQEISEPLPAHLQPIRLNDDGILDYAGGDWHSSSASVLPTPIYETVATTDGGKTFQTIRSNAFGCARSFVDVNGDGNLDIIAESTGLFAGGIRESINRFLASREIRHRIDVYLQNSQGVFSTQAGLSAQLDILLDAPPVRETKRFLSYQTGYLTDLSGDFNKDGRKDLLAYDRPDRLAVYLNHENSFSSEPDAEVTVPLDSEFSVVDLDGDGCSDIIISWINETGATDSRVFLFREKAE